MAFRRMRSRFRRRARNRWMWSGVLYEDVQVLQPTAVIMELIGPATPTPNDVSPAVRTDCLLTRTIMGLTARNDILLDSRITFALQVCDVSVAGTPLVIVPDPTDADYYQRSNILWTTTWYFRAEGSAPDWVGTMFAPFAASAGSLVNNGNPFDITVKRRMRLDQGLYLVAWSDVVGEGTGDVQVTMWARTLVSLGRR